MKVENFHGTLETLTISGDAEHSNNSDPKYAITKPTYQYEICAQNQQYVQPSCI